MNFRNSFEKCAVALLAVFCVSAGAVYAQVPRPGTVKPVFSQNLPLATGNNLYCAGYIQKSAINTSNRIVGAVEEQDRFNYAEGNLMYINVGADKGVHVGDMFSVVRPKGQVDTKWTKKGRLGFFVQEVGAVEVVAVKANVSAARIHTSCDTFLLGDLLQPIEQRSSAMFQQRPAMDIFADPSGKANGRIFMARDLQEMVTRDQVVYVDLGREDNIQTGDYLTIYRKLGKGNLSKMPDNTESVSARDYGYHSLEYKGGKFSNQAQRKSGDTAEGRVVTTKRAKQGRPDLRKIVGEGVIVNVKERTATVVITRTAQEIHTGDWVELQ
ncbi:MAG: hypothetical protein ABI999_09650 [Acidobacteriota bacterium]